MAARLLRHLLEQARPLLDQERVVGLAAIEARLFDLDLQLTALAVREARRQELEQARRARELGLGRGSVNAVRDEAPPTTLDPDSEAARILRACVRWPVGEWMVLSPDRRLFLFGHARAFGGDPALLDAIALGVLDRLIEAGDGPQVEAWIGRVGPAEAGSSGAGSEGSGCWPWTRASVNAASSPCIAVWTTWSEGSSPRPFGPWPSPSSMRRSPGRGRSCRA